MIYLLFVWVMCGIIGLMVGQQKGIAPLGCAMGFLLGPLGLVVVLLMAGNRVECQWCKTRIRPDAAVCPQCHRDNPVPEAAGPAPPPEETELERRHREQYKNFW